MNVVITGSRALGSANLSPISVPEVFLILLKYQLETSGCVGTKVLRFKGKLPFCTHLLLNCRVITNYCKIVHSVCTWIFYLTNFRGMRKLAY